MPMIALRRGVLAITTAVLTVAVGTVSTAPSQASDAPVCSGTAMKTNGTLTTYIPAPSASCYMGLYQGSIGAVRLVQRAILDCYPGTNAYSYIHDHGGADGVYGPYTVKAVRAVQYAAGFRDGYLDGVYGPRTRDIMRWPTTGVLGGVGCQKLSAFD